MAQLSERREVVTEEQVQEAVDFLQARADAIGEAKKRSIKAGHMIKYIEALEMKKSLAKTESAKKADARTSDQYFVAINEDAVAAGELAKEQSLREAAKMKIEVWRSASANLRSIKL